MNKDEIDILRRWVEEERDRYMRACVKRAHHTLRDGPTIPLDEVPNLNMLRELRLNYEEASHALRVAEGRDGP
jgi:hypothetical protein